MFLNLKDNNDLVLITIMVIIQHYISSAHMCAILTYSKNGDLQQHVVARPGANCPLTTPAIKTSRQRYSAWYNGVIQIKLNQDRRSSPWLYAKSTSSSGAGSHGNTVPTGHGDSGNRIFCPCSR